MNLNDGTVCRYTMDLGGYGKKELGIQGKSIDLLHELLSTGYVESNAKNYYRLRKLKRFFPMIQRATIDSCSIYYINEKSKDAVAAFVARNKSRVISYQDLKRITKVFDLDLDSSEKKNLIIKEVKTSPIIRKKEGGYLSSFRENQTKLDDFLPNIASLVKVLS